MARLWMPAASLCCHFACCTIKTNAQCWFQKELCGMTREMPVSSCIIFINYWDATEYQWITFVDLGYLLRGKYMVEKSALSTLLLWWTEMDVTTTCYPVCRGTDISIDPVRINHAAHTACVRCTLYLCTALCTFTNDKKGLFCLVETS